MVNSVVVGQMIPRTPDYQTDVLAYVMWAVIIIGWWVGYFWLFKKTKNRLIYALPCGIFVFLFPLILSPVIYCLFSERPSLISFIFTILGSTLNVMLILSIAGWIYAWVWLFKKTKQIKKTKDRFKYALWRAIFLPTFPLILPVCFLIFAYLNMEILGLLLGLFLTLIGFLYWSRPPFVTRQNDKTFKRRLIISVFLTLACLVASYLYFAANATCCSIPSPDGNYNGTFAKDFASDTDK